MISSQKKHIEGSKLVSWVGELTGDAPETLLRRLSLHGTPETSEPISGNTLLTAGTP